jgi:hypothetical protein
MLMCRVRWTIRMDCRVKPGNDEVKSGGRKKRDQNLGPEYLVERAEGDVGGR